MSPPSGRQEPGTPVPGSDTIPWDQDAEESVLGAVLLDHRAIARVAGKLSPVHFYRDADRALFGVLLELAGAGIDADPVVVADELRRRGILDTIGGAPRLATLAAQTPYVGNIERHAAIIRDRARARELLAASLELRAAALNGGLDKHPEVVLRLRTLLDRPVDGTVTRLDELELDALLAGDPPVTPWLWRGWLAQGDLATIVADPGVGKSLLMIALGVILRGGGGDLLEEPVIGGRFGYIDLEQPLSEVHARLVKLGLRFDDVDGLHYAHNPDLNIATPDGIARVEKMVVDGKLDLLVIDSLRAAAPGADENDSGAMSSIMTPLRRITSTHGTTIVVIHHARKRTGEGPSDAISLVRGSGAITAAVDTVLYLRAKSGETDAYTIEHGKSRRGAKHESILVRLTDTESDDGLPAITFSNEGNVASTVDKVQELLERIVTELRSAGEPLPRKLIALRLGVAVKDRSFGRALNVGWDRGLLAKSTAGVGKPTFYAYAGIEHETEHRHANLPDDPRDEQASIDELEAAIAEEREAVLAEEREAALAGEHEHGRHLYAVDDPEGEDV